MSVIYTIIKQLPVRRDKQISNSVGSSSVIAGSVIPSSNVWGHMIGTLADQGDLNTALGLKLTAASGIAYDSYRLGGALANTYAPLASPTFTGIITTPELVLTNSAGTSDGSHNVLFGAYKPSVGYHNLLIDAYSYHFKFFGTEKITILSNSNVGLGFLTPLSALCINGGLHIGGDSAAGDNNLLVDGTIKGESLESVTTFSSGFAGDGYKVIETGGVSSLEVDKLIVRGILQAYELQINKISSVNGGIIISIANAKCTTVSGTTIYFDEGIGLTIPFVVNDYIKAQQFTGTGVASYLGKVTAVNAGNIVATTQAGYDAPWNGMDLVQLGNSNTGTYSARQNAIYLTAADTNNPYIAGYSGITDGLLAGHEKFRLGNLTGITDATLSPLGYGLYAQNVFLSGKIVATSGTIGGWTIGSTTLTGGNAVLSNTGVLTLGTGNDVVVMSAADATYRLWIGNSTPASAPFFVTKAGALTAKGVAEFGTAISTYDGISNVAIKGRDIWENSFNGDYSEISINRLGYNGTAIYSRNFGVYDGMGNRLLTASGSNHQVVIDQDLTVTGNAGFHGMIIHMGYTTTERDALSAPEGTMIFNKTTHQPNYYTQGQWWNMSLS